MKKRTNNIVYIDRDKFLFLWIPICGIVGIIVGSIFSYLTDKYLFFMFFMCFGLIMGILLGNVSYNKKVRKYMNVARQQKNKKTKKKNLKN